MKSGARIDGLFQLSERRASIPSTERGFFEGLGSNNVEDEDFRRRVRVVSAQDTGEDGQIKDSSAKDELSGLPNVFDINFKELR